MKIKQSMVTIPLKEYDKLKEQYRSILLMEVLKNQNNR